MKKEKTLALLANILTFLFVIPIYLTYLKISRVGTNEFTSLNDLLAGKADTPYIYRVLIPQSAKLFAKIIPPIPHNLFSKSEILQESFLNLNGDILPKEAFLVLFLTFLAMIGFIYVEKRFLFDLGFSQETQLILPILLLAHGLLFTIRFGYIYDMPQLFLFTTSLWLLFRRQWKWYLVLFLITTLNKETSILLTATYAIYFYKRLSKKEFFKLLFWQLFPFIIIRIILLWVYRDNSGSVIYSNFFIHVEKYKAFPIFLAITIFLFVTIFFLVKNKWAKKNDFLRSAIIVPLLILPLYFYGGIPMEFRVFLEALPILGVLAFNPDILH